MIDVLLEKADTVAPALAFCRYKRRKAVELKRNLSYFNAKYFNSIAFSCESHYAEELCQTLENIIEDCEVSIKLMENFK